MLEGSGQLERHAPCEGIGRAALDADRRERGDVVHVKGQLEPLEADFADQPRVEFVIEAQRRERQLVVVLHEARRGPGLFVVLLAVFVGVGAEFLEHGVLARGLPAAVEHAAVDVVVDVDVFDLVDQRGVVPLPAAEEGAGGA